MSLPLLKRSRFLEDYAGIVLSLQDLNPKVANRICDEVEAALKLISTHPEIARRAGFSKAPDVRIWPVRRYPNYVMLYRVTPTHAVLLRLLHGAQDLPRLVPAE